MAKKMIQNNFIAKASDLVTSRSETRAGFIAMALEKNLLAGPYIDEARALKALAQQYSSASELINVTDLRQGLLTASGLSEKALAYLDDGDKTIAIQGLIDEFLAPAGEQFVDELVYRYLLTKGDALGGKARNLAGALGERKFLKTMIPLFKLLDIPFHWQDSETKKWLAMSQYKAGDERRIKALAWVNGNGSRLLVLNTTVSLVKKNVDLVLLNCSLVDYMKDAKKALQDETKFIGLGELKGGVDPAGADEHWKTANSALERIRKAFASKGCNPMLFFIGAAIESAMADEIFNQLKSGSLSGAANLSIDNQLVDLCNGIIKS